MYNVEASLVNCASCALVPTQILLTYVVGIPPVILIFPDPTML